MNLYELSMNPFKLPTLQQSKKCRGNARNGEENSQNCIGRPSTESTPVSRCDNYVFQTALYDSTEKLFVRKMGAAFAHNEKKTLYTCGEGPAVRPMV